MPTLNWIGKDAVINHHLEVPFRLLKDVPELGCGDPGSGNLIVEGDNLGALKALLPYYKGRVKCACIDPPYNTGNEGWAYNDNVNSPAIQKWLKEALEGRTIGKEGETLDRHDRWLCMMYPRLALLREFLTPDGIIIVFLDDNEIHALRYLLEEIFGIGNFVATLVWEKGRKNDARFISSGHEYVMIFARNFSFLKEGGVKWRKEKAGALEIHEEFMRLRALYGDSFSQIESDLKNFYKELPKNHPSKKHSRYNKVDSTGVWRDDNMSWPGGGGPSYDVIHPVTKKPCRVPDGGWRYATPEKMAKMIVQGKVVFRDDHSEPPIRKTYLVRDQDGGDDDDIGSEVMGSYFYRSALQASNNLLQIFGRKPFENPKDHEIVADLISYVTKSDPNCIVIDSFGGSGTTAHSVLHLNHLFKGNRRFILIELQQEIAREITRERVKRVAMGYTTKGKAIPGLGGGFRYVTLGDALFDETGQIRCTVRFADLARHVYFTETGEPLPKERVSAKSPLLGIHQGKAIYLLYNGILKDRSVNGGNALCRETLQVIEEINDGHEGVQQTVVFGTSQRLSPARLKRGRIDFKQIPYHLRIS
jgi:adenine-specific DNA-methyltransferase